MSPDDPCSRSTRAATWAHLLREGVPFTSLRNGFYGNSLSIHLDTALATGQIVVPEDGPISWTAHEDLAEAAVIALTQADAFDGVTPPLTASAALDLADVAGLLTDLTGRIITRVTVSDDEWLTAAIGRGLPPMVADFSLGMFRAARRGEFDVTDPILETVLGHATTPVARTLSQLLP